MLGEVEHVFCNLHVLDGISTPDFAVVELTVHARVESSEATRSGKRFWAALVSRHEHVPARAAE
jgi:hypothetical protein